MKNTQKLLNICCITLGLLALSSAGLAANPPASRPVSIDTTNPQSLPSGQIESALYDKDNNRYALRYVPEAGVLEILAPSTQLIVNNIPEGYSPVLVGAEKRIRFLPIGLQPYLERGFGLFITAIRTSGGSGSGFCGAGVEVYLNVLKMDAATPRLVSSNLIESCAKDIELASQDSDRLDPDKLAAFSVAGKRLTLHFLSYGNLAGSQSACLSRDMKTLQFAPRCDQTTKSKG